MLNLLSQVKRLTQVGTQALDNVASIFIKQMVPGRATTELKMDDNVMLLTKDYADVVVNQSFGFSSNSGFDLGLTVRITAQGEKLASSDKVLGLGVSTYIVHKVALIILLRTYYYHKVSLISAINLGQCLSK